MLRLPEAARPGANGWRVAFAVVLAAVVVGSVLPPGDDPATRIAVPDWLQHGLGYGVLMVTLVASQAQPRLWWSALVLVALGLALELVQGWLGYRYAELKDLLANAAGIGLAGAGMAMIARRAASGIG